MSKFKEAMDELARLSKSESPENELDALAKALQQELGDGVVVDLRKSGDDPGGKTQAELDEEAEVLRKAQEEEEADNLRKAQEAEAEAERLRKAQEETEEDELIKASEAYASLQESVEKGQETTLGEIALLKKSVGALLDLNIKLVGVISEMSKSQKEQMTGMEDMKKSLGAMGGAPTSPSGARIGLGEGDHHEAEFKKSWPEVQDALIKAINDNKADARYLTVLGTYRDPNKLPPEVLEALEPYYS